MNGCFGLIYKDNQSKILLVKRRDIPIWVLPGGYIENEKSEETVVREVFEETGFRVKVVKKVGEYRYTGLDKTNHTFLCFVIGGKKTLSKESKDIRYFRVDRLPKKVSPYANKMIQDGIKNGTEVVRTRFKRLPIAFWLKAFLHPWGLLKFLLTKIGIHWNI